MFNSKRFAPPLTTGVFVAACLACGSAAAQDAAASKATQDTPQASRDAASGLPTGKRQHKPMVITKDMDMKAGHHDMADMDTDKDGRLSRAEFAAAHDGKMDEFAGHDGNGDGFITQAEMDAHHASMKAAHDATHTMQQGSDKPHH